MAILITGISELITCDESLDGADQTDGLGILRDAAVVVSEGRHRLEDARRLGDQLRAAIEPLWEQS